jgi:hypothetical protein
MADTLPELLDTVGRSDPDWLRLFLQRQQIAEARASVNLDLHSGVHTCYEGHCEPREPERDR